MPNDDQPLPDPVDIEEQADAMPPKVSLWNYAGGLRNLRNKGYNYREIAEWISKLLGVDINRHQIVYVLNADPAAHDEAEEEDREDRDDETALAALTADKSIRPNVLLPKQPPVKRPRRRRKKVKS